MPTQKKIVVAVGLNPNLTEPLEALRDLPLTSEDEVHFIHVFNTFKYSSFLTEFPFVTPIKPDLGPIQESIVILLKKISEEVLPDYKGNLVFKCLFDENPKERFTDYVNEVEPDLVIIAKRKKRGFFESSFAQFVTKHTNANTLLLKA